MNTTAIFRPNTSHAVKQADLDKCKIASFRTIPQAYTTNYVGGYYDPGDIKCKTTNSDKIRCKRTGDVYIPPSAVTYDANQTIRWRQVKACLRQKGYAVIDSLPFCSTAEERAQALRAKTVHDFTCIPDGDLDY